MLRNSLLVKEFSYEDDATVEFSVDPLMYDKLGIKKAKKGMESVFDTDKIKDFQLKKDIAKIKQVRGSYKKRNNLYLKIRETDPYYRVIAQKKKLGAAANFNDLLPYTVDASWRATSQPYGVIAEKRYQEYIANLPKGPSLEEVEDKLQRRTDHQLYRKIITGVLEPTRAEIREREKREAEQAEREELEAHVVDIHKADREWAKAIKEERFDDLRKLPTLRQHNSSMKDWHKGINYPYEIEKGCPIVEVDDSRVPAGSTIIPELRGWESFTPNRVFSAKKYTHGEKLADKEYLKQLGQLNYELALSFLEENRIRLEQEAKKAQELKDLAEKQRRRVGAGSSNIRDLMTQVKLEAVKEKHSFGGVKAEEASDSEEEDESSSGSEDEEKEQDEEDQISRKQSQKGSSGKDAAVTRPLSGKSVSSPSGKPTISGKITLKGGVASAKAAAGGGGGVMTVRRRRRSRPLTCSERMFRPFASKSAVAPFDSLDDIAADEEEVEEGELESEGEVKRSLGSVLSESVMKAHQAFMASLRAGGTACRTACTATVKRIRSGISTASERFEDWRSSGQFGVEKSKKKNYAAIQMRRELEAVEKQLKVNTQAEKYLNPEVVEEKMPEMVSSEEFYEILKMQRKKIKYQMKDLKQRNKKMTKVDQRTYRGLERRLLQMAVAEKERRQLDNIDVNKAARIRGYLDEYKGVLDDELTRYRSTRRYKVMHWYSMYRARKKKERAEALAKKNAAFQLKQFNREENETLFELLVSLRLKEKELEQRASVWIARFLCTTYTPPVREYTVDDLILACNAGRYKEVLDIVTSPIYYVGPNEVNTDGLTPTYSTLMMILQNAVLEDDRNVELLMYSKWQRFKRKYLTLSKKQQTASQLEYCLQILLNQGGDVTYATQESGKDGTTVLHNAAEVGGIEMIQWLLNKGMDVNTLSTKLKKTALMVAVEHNKLDIVMLLMKCGGMDLINHADVEGWNVLHYATLTASLEMIKVLLICGAKTTMRNSQGRLPQEEAIHRGKVEINLLIMSHRSVIVDHLSRIEFLDEELYSRYTSHVTKGKSLDELEEGEEVDEEEQKVDDSDQQGGGVIGGGGGSQEAAENRLVEKETAVETHIRHTFDDFKKSGAAPSAAVGGISSKSKSNKKTRPVSAPVR